MTHRKLLWTLLTNPQTMGKRVFIPSLFGRSLIKEMIDKLSNFYNIEQVDKNSYVVRRK